MQRFVEYTLTDSCLVVLASQGLNTNVEARILGSWRTQVIVIPVLLALGWLSSQGTEAAILSGLMTTAYGVMTTWSRWASRPVGITVKSDALFREAIEEIRSRRVPSRSVMFVCPDDSQVWETLVGDLLPFVDAAVVLNRDLGEATEARIAAAASNAQLPGLAKELDAAVDQLGAAKIVVLLDEHDELAPGIDGAIISHIPSRIPYLPIAKSSRRLAVDLEAAIEKARTGRRGSNALASALWAPGDDRRRPGWQRVVIVLLAFGILCASFVLAVVGAMLFAETAKMFSRVDSDPFLWVQTPYVGDGFWYWKLFVIGIAASLSMLFWLWRKRPLARTFIGDYLSNLVVVSLLSGMNFEAGTVPRDALGYAECGLALCGWLAFRTIRKVAPTSRGGVAIRALSMFLFLSFGTLIPLLFGVLLIKPGIYSIAERPVHPVSYISMTLAAIVVIRIARRDLRSRI